MMKILRCIIVVAVLGMAVADFPDVTTIYRLYEHEANDTGAMVTQWWATIDAHARGHSIGFPFQLTDGSVRGPNLDADFEDCSAWYDECAWNVSESWTLRRTAEHTQKPRLSLGTVSYTDVLNNSESEGRRFLERIEMEFEITEVTAPSKRNMTLVLETTDNTVYVIFHGIDESSGGTKEVLSLHKCTQDNYHDLEKCPSKENKNVNAMKWLPNEKYSMTVDVNATILTIKLKSVTLPTVWIVDDQLVSTYRVKLSGMAGRVTSRGDRDLLFSLDDVEGTITSAEYSPTSSGPDICVAIDCLMEEGTTLDVVAKIDDEDYILSKTSRVVMGLWTRVFFTKTLTGDEKNQLRILEVVAKKKSTGDDQELLIQRIASCSIPERTEDVLQLEEDEYSLPVSGEGFTVARNQWAVSSGLPLTCRNGGLWDKDYQYCNCPAGFNGTVCEEGCGPNRYGDDCGGMCSQTKRACRGMYLCRPKRPCDCAPGYQGHFCDKVCAEGYYGAGCKQRCGECAAGTCNIYTGTCHQGCKPGYTLPLCQYTYNYLTVPPYVKDSDDNGKEIHISASFLDLNGDTTHKPSSYQLQYRIADESQEGKAAVLWLKQPVGDYPGPKDISVGKLASLEPGREYQIRVVLIDRDSGSYEGSLVPVLNYTTQCQVPDTVDYNIEVNPLAEQDGLRVKWKYSTDAKTESDCSVALFEIHVKLCWQWTVHEVYPLHHVASQYDVTDLLHGERYEVKMRAVTIQGPAHFSPTIPATVRDQAPLSHVNDLTSHVIEDSCRVAWNPPRHNTNDLDHYKVTYECIRLLACPEKIVPENCGLKSKITSDQSTWFYDLLPYTKYNISVYVVDKSGLEGPSLSILITTNPQKPNVSLSSGDPESTRDESSVTVYWKAPDDKNCHLVHGAVLGYSCDVEYNERYSSILQSKTSLLPQVTFDGLKPSTEYRVSVRAVTSAGKTDEPLTILVNTTAPSPNPVDDLEVYKRTGTTLGVRWSDPYPADNLRSFSVKFYPSGSASPALAKTVTVKYKDAPCTAWPDKQCYVIDRLAPDTLYDIEVRARNNEIDKDGKPRFLEKVMTNETRPGAPTDLIFKSANATSLTLQWNIPDLLNSHLIYYMAHAKYLGPGPEGGTPHRVSMVEVYEEQETYSTTISKLKAGSEYLVSVAAHNMKEAGPVINGTFSTTEY